MLDDILPTDDDGIFVGRIHDYSRGRPVPVAYIDSCFWDLSHVAMTVSELLEMDDCVACIEEVVYSEKAWAPDSVRVPFEIGDSRGTLLSPIDLQAVKACGVTFVDSMIERVIEEKAQGDAIRAKGIRDEVSGVVGSEVGSVRPGSAQAELLKSALKEKGWWSQYLEVGLGPDPEVFTKAQPLSTVGSGDYIGVPSFSSWSNSEPELALIINSSGKMVGVTLGNDVNLRDVEGRSALLLGRAKDNNRSAAVGPLIRLFDRSFSIDDARSLTINMSISGDDGFRLTGESSTHLLSRSFEELLKATMGPHHQYPDGCILFTGTLFAPTEDRSAQGAGFTHQLGDVVRIWTDTLGNLKNTVHRTEDLPPWTYGFRSLFADLTGCTDE